MEKNQETNLWKSSPTYSYLRNIAIFKRIESPLGMKKNDGDNNIIESDGMHYRQQYTPTFVLGEILDVDGKIMATGHFSAKLMRYDWRYICKGVGVQEQEAPYIVYDNGVFNSIISNDFDDMGISLETDISSNRRVSGYNYDVNNECASFCGNNNSSYSTSTADSYRLVDGIYLIHSSNYNPGFEVYRTSKNFNIADGISSLVPEIFITFKGSVPVTDEDRLEYYKKHRK